MIFVIPGRGQHLLPCVCNGSLFFYAFLSFLSLLLFRDSVSTTPLRLRNVTQCTRRAYLDRVSLREYHEFRLAVIALRYYAVTNYVMSILPRHEGCVRLRGRYYLLPAVARPAVVEQRNPRTPPPPHVLTRTHIDM